MFTEMILLQHSFHFKFPRVVVSVFFMRPHYPLVSPFILQGCLKYQWDSLLFPATYAELRYTIPLCFAHIIQGILES